MYINTVYILTNYDIGKTIYINSYKIYIICWLMCMDILIDFDIDTRRRVNTAAFIYRFIFDWRFQYM